MRFFSLAWRRPRRALVAPQPPHALPFPFRLSALPTRKAHCPGPHSPHVPPTIACPHHCTPRLPASRARALCAVRRPARGRPPSAPLRRVPCSLPTKHCHLVVQSNPFLLLFYRCKPCFCPVFGAVQRRSGRPRSRRAALSSEWGAHRVNEAGCVRPRKKNGACAPWVVGWSSGGGAVAPRDELVIILVVASRYMVEPRYRG
jgi:hypothetical protein